MILLIITIFSQCILKNRNGHPNKHEKTHLGKKNRNLKKKKK